MKLETFLIKANIKFDNKFNYSKISFIKNKFRNKAKVCIICPDHGDFLQSPYHHLNSLHGCNLCAMKIIGINRSYTVEDFLKKAIKKHDSKYDYSLIKFSSLKEEVEIICPTHGKFLQKAKTHLQSGCIECRNDSIKLSICEIIERANKKHNNIYDYKLFTKYKNNKCKIDIICNIHGVFSMRVDAHLRGNKCPKCKYILYKEKLFFNFVKKSNLIHNNKYKYINDEIFNSTIRIKIICPIHGLFEQLKWCHSAGSECPECCKIGRRLTQNEFIERAKIIHNDKYDYSLVIFSKINFKVKIICKKHGIFKQLPSSHLYVGSGCPKCSKIVSKKETKWLNSLNISKEYRNKILLLNGKSYFPDAFIPETNTIYEFYGDFWHGNLSRYKSDDINHLSNIKFGDLYQRTINRETLFKNNGYKIITIWESDWDKIKNEAK